MQIIEIRAATAPISSPMRNAVISFAGMTCSIVAVLTDVVRDGRRVVGFGFNSNGRYSAACLLNDRFIPRLMAAEPMDLVDQSGGNLDPARVWATAMQNEKPGGHGERAAAVGALDMAIWDAVAKVEGVPLWKLLGSPNGSTPSPPSVFVYAAGGYYNEADDLRELRSELRGYLDLGYTLVKIKVGGASLDHDLRRIDAAVKVVGSPAALAVDANARFDEPRALEYAHALSGYGLAWFEEPCDPLDFKLLAAVADVYKGPLATGENLFSMQDARNLLRYGGLRPDRDILQFDCSLSYGLVEYVRILDALQNEGWTALRVIPHGGHQMSLHLAAGLGLGGNESYPGLFRPFGGFEDGVPILNGRVDISDRPGIGVEAKAELFALMTSSLGVSS